MEKAPARDADAKVISMVISDSIDNRFLKPLFGYDLCTGMHPNFTYLNVKALSTRRKPL